MKVISDISINVGKLKTFRLKLLFDKVYSEQARKEISDNLIRIFQGQETTDESKTLSDYDKDVRTLYDSLAYRGPLKVDNFYVTGHHQTAFVLSNRSV